MLLFASITIRAGEGELRQGCSAADALVAALPAGTPVELRFVLNDGSDCYKVSAFVAGERVDGYLHGPALSGLESFERGLREAPVMASAPAPVAQSLRAEPRSEPIPGEKLYGMRVLLAYDAAALPVDTARSLVGVLDSEYGRVSAQLGCAGQERVIAILQTRQAYLRSTDAAEWSAGLYDGRIRVALPEPGRAGPDLPKVLAHEVVHACLASLWPRWPAWFQEGVARKLSGDVLSAGEAAHIRQMASAHTLPRLENIAQSWSRMSVQHAQTAYAVALAAVELLEPNLRNIVSNPGLLPGVTADLNRRLGL